jgi:hypothetical protein
MQGFAEVFYGRQTAYLAAFAAPDRRELEMALARNILAAMGLDRAVWRDTPAP